jgi:hypothetical protein
MLDDSVPQQLDLPAIRARRANLRRTGARLREALDQPQGDVEGWVGAVSAAAQALAEAWQTHSAVTESPDGVLAQIVDDAPRLARQVGRLQAEHAEIEALLRLAAGQLPGAGAADPAGIRAELGAVLDRIARHRRTGGELIYQAYQIDIGGE